MANTEGTQTTVPTNLFSIHRVVMIGVAFGTLVVVADVYDEKTAMWIGASLFAIMLFTTDMGNYLARVIRGVSSSAVKG